MDYIIDNNAIIINRGNIKLKCDNILYSDGDLIHYDSMQVRNFLADACAAKWIYDNYDTISNHNIDLIEVCQYRKHMVLPDIIDKDKVYFCGYYVREGMEAEYNKYHGGPYYFNALVDVLKEYYHDVNIDELRNIKWILIHNMFCMSKENFNKYSYDMKNIIDMFAKKCLNDNMLPSKEGCLVQERMITFVAYILFGAKNILSCEWKIYDNNNCKKLTSYCGLNSNLYTAITSNIYATRWETDYEKL